MFLLHGGLLVYDLLGPSRLAHFITKIGLTLEGFQDDFGRPQLGVTFLERDSSVHIVREAQVLNPDFSHVTDHAQFDFQVGLTAETVVHFILQHGNDRLALVGGLTDAGQFILIPSDIGETILSETFQRVKAPVFDTKALKSGD